MQENKKPTPAELLQARRYDPNRQPAPEQILLRVGGKKVGGIQNLVTVSGKQKNGKSRYVGAAIAAGITRNEIFQISLKTPPGRGRIALFDTEQADYDFFRQMEQIKQFAGISRLPASFDAFNTREDDPHIQIKMIEHYLQENSDCSVIILDGLLDLLISYNDERESKILINFIKRVTKQHQCLMIGVMHRGKGSDQTIGHLGSMADRVAQSVLKVEKVKDRGTYCLSSEFMRSDEDFAPVEIWYNAGQWQEAFPVPEQQEGAKIKPLQRRPVEYDIGEHQDNLQQIFNAERFLTYQNLANGIKEIYAVGYNWAVDCIKYLREKNLVFRHPEGYSIDNQIEAKLFVQL